MTILHRLGSRCRRAWFAAHGVRFDARVQVEPGASLERGFHEGTKGTITVGAGCEIRRGACLHAWGGQIILGRDVFVGPYVVIYGHGGVEIGDQALISMHCRILSSNHALPARTVAIRSQPDQRKRTAIGRDVWLGAGVTVLAGVNIGDGCVVGAGAVVTTDLPPWSIALGVPARITGQRACPPG